jgi:uncharacterized protein
MIKVRLAFAIIVLFLAPVQILSPIAHGSSPVYAWMRTIHVLVPAVSYVNGVYKGVISELIVTVAWPGNGIVYFAADPLTEIDTQAAARMAVLVASMLAGVDYHSLDYFIHLKAPAPIVGGPSASGAMAVAVLAALRGSNIGKGFSMTGMVEPDAVLGPVGGIPQKLEAVARKGIKKFVIPLGQGYSRDLNTGRLVDVITLGKQLGVNVTPVPTILDAYVEATGDKQIVRQLLHVSLPGYPYWLLQQLRVIAEKFASLAESNLTCWEQLSIKLRPEYVAALRDYALEVNQSLRAYEANIKSHFYYSAASYAFRAAIDATYLCKAAKILSSDNPLSAARKTITKLLASSQKLLEKANSTMAELMAQRPTDAFVQLAVTALLRINDAVKAINYANNSLRGLAPSNVMDALYAAVYAYYRSLTAIQWSKATLRASSTGVPISWYKLRDSLNTLLYFARTEAEYLQTLGVDISSVYDSLESAKRFIEENNPRALLKATALTLDTVSTLTSTLHQAFSVDIRDSIRAVERSFDIILRLDIAKYNTTPIIPLLYYEYSITLTDLQSKLAILVEASSYATLLASLSAKPATKPPLGGVHAAKTVTKTVTVALTHTQTLTKEVEKTVEKTLTRTVTLTSTTTKTLTLSTPITVEKTVAKTITAKSPQSSASLALSIIISLVIGFTIGALVGRRR